MNDREILLREEFRLKFTHSYMEDPTNVLILGEIENYWLKVLHHEREQLIELLTGMKYEGHQIGYKSDEIPDPQTYLEANAYLKQKGEIQNEVIDEIISILKN